MRTRAFGTALILSIALPSLLSEAGLHSIPGAEPAALAQTADAATEVARQRYEEGIRLFDAGRYDDARAAFLQTYALKRHPAVLLNLGQSEIRSGHPEDGGNHLQQFLREFAAATPEQRESAEKGIGEAKKKAGFIIVLTDAYGADVSVDGVAIGRAPLLDPYFVKPGKHTVLATYQNKSATTQVDAKPASAAAANLVLGTSGSAPPPGVAPPPANPGGTAHPGSATPPLATTPQPTQPNSPGNFAPPGSPPPFFTLPPLGDLGADETTGREPFFSWYKRKPLAWVGTGVAALGLVGGIGFSIAAASASGAVTRDTKVIKDHSQDDPTTNYGQFEPCGSPDKSGTDRPGYGKACDALRSDISAYNGNVAVAVTGFVVMGAAIAGTAAYVLTDWFPSTGERARADGRSLAIAPIVTPTERGVGVIGRF